VLDAQSAAHPGRDRDRGARAVGHELRGEHSRGRPLLASRPRVGGPYTVTATISGFQPYAVKDVTVSLGVTSDLSLKLTAGRRSPRSDGRGPDVRGLQLGAHGRRDDDRPRRDRRTCRASTTASTTTPRLSPQYSGGPFGGGFVGQDNRPQQHHGRRLVLQQLVRPRRTAGRPHERDADLHGAVEEIQINVAPYDVRQGHFVGAGVNMVTRSGANQFRGSGYYWWRDNGLVGTEAKGLAFNPGTFDYHRYGAWVSGPILRDKLFFFGSYENDKFNQPGTTFRANNGGETVAGNTDARPQVRPRRAQQLPEVELRYDTGGYQDYPFETPGQALPRKFDYNLNPRNKMSLRYLQLDSQTPVLLSNSGSLGAGNRRSSTTGLNFANSNYAILEKIWSGVGEWNSILSSNMANSLIVGYTKNDESRPQSGTIFPMVDIREAGSVYTTFGYEPFTPANQLRYHTFQVQDNFTWSKSKHTFTFGATAERYHSDNVFFRARRASTSTTRSRTSTRMPTTTWRNPNRTTSPVTLAIFQVRWNNIPGQTEPLQPLDVWYGGIYGQDEWQAEQQREDHVRLRLDLSSFGDTGFTNANADSLTFRDAPATRCQYQSGKLPDASCCGRRASASTGT
jgi:hypothetical protein